ncbi:MAG: nucleotide exchange factor GrpE [Gammaproteobacteria bacterium]|nr:MAG: nucleotide exchange factor GrpE [Gammaproteobacteria bacterium]
MNDEEMKQAEEQASQSNEAVDQDQESGQQQGEQPHETAEASSDQPSVEDLLNQLEAAQQTIKDQKDSVLRAAAEEQNVRRRAERDVENAHKFALEKFTNDLLPVVDTLERALEAATGEDEALVATREGVELTLKMLLDAMKKHGVEQLDPTGEPFNPQEHEAMSMQPNPDMEPNTVMAVLQKGYSLSGRLVRPAMVIVSKAP